MKSKETKSAGGVVLNKDSLLLLVNQNNNSWSLPKGHIDEGESALEAAKREIYEESGIKNLEFIKELGDYKRYRIALDGGDDKSELKHIFMFLFKTEEIELSPKDPDNPEARWLNFTDAVKLLSHPKDKEFLSEFIKNFKY